MIKSPFCGLSEARASFTGKAKLGKYPSQFQPLTSGMFTEAGSIRSPSIFRVSGWSARNWYIVVLPRVVRVPNQPLLYVENALWPFNRSFAGWLSDASAGLMAGSGKARLNDTQFQPLLNGISRSTKPEVCTTCGATGVPITLSGWKVKFSTTSP